MSENLPEKTQNLTSSPEKKWDFNYWTTKIFLENSRLTVLSLLLLIALGVFTTISLKTTGFPSPEVPIALVQTVYPGASSETVMKEITIPLENALKDVEGVKRFSSTSNNSFSNVTVTLDEKANSDNVRNKISSAIASLELPEDAQTPKVLSIDISGPDIILAISHPDLPTLYENYSKATNDLNQLESVASIEPIYDLKKDIVIKIDAQKAREKNITPEIVQGYLATFGENIPVISNVNLDEKEVSIATSVKGQTLQDLQNLQIFPAPQTPATNPAQAAGSIPQIPGQTPNATIQAAQTGPTNPTQIGQANQTASQIQPVKLTDIAQIETVYNFSDNKQGQFGFYADSQGKLVQAVILSLKAAEGTDQGQFKRDVEKTLNYSETQYIEQSQLSSSFDQTKLNFVELFTVNESNSEQIDQVISGTIGEKIGDSPLGYFGYLLGGIQLVVLVMIAFVSWRAALVAAAAIPLSLIFSNIWIWYVGEDLNTLVLFSLVLVLGLVVDPALVVLEAIQRKLDAGFRGQKAVLEAVKDIGGGVFLAALTNIIVFVPFGILSGIFGQIFRYIPLTIIPAVIGSYIVPLVFLAWLGGLILKPSKNAKGSEEENLWPIAKWLIAFNTKILHSSVWVRSLIIALGLIIPLLLSYLLFSTGKIKQVQFASSDDSELVNMSGRFLPSINEEKRNQATTDILKEISSNPNVTSAFAVGESFDYLIRLTDSGQRELKASEIIKDLDEKIQQKYGEKAANPVFFDFKLAAEQTGGPQADYEIAISIQNDNLELLKKASTEIGKEIEQKLCLEDSQAKILDDCRNKTIIKVDDGFTGKDNILYNFQFDRDALIKNQLAAPGRGPLTIGLNGQIRQQFELNRGEKVATVTDNQQELEVFLDTNQDKVNTVEELKNEITGAVPNSTSDSNTILEVIPTSPKASIQRIGGQTVSLVQFRLNTDLKNNQGFVQSATQEIIKYYNQNGGEKAKSLGLKEGDIKESSDGSSSDAAKSFQELGVALLLAIFVSYLVLAIFLKSLSQPLSIIYTVPLTFLGVLPALALFVGGQFGFLEIIGLIILVGIVENAAIFLIDSANQKVEEGWDDKRAISYASGVRFRPIILTSLTAIASLAPLAITSEFYRSIAVVIMFGIFASGLLSLITTPILYIFFRWLSGSVSKLVNRKDPNNEFITGKV